MVNDNLEGKLNGENNKSEKGISKRFVVYENGQEVYDRNTGFTWFFNLNGCTKMDWDEAKHYLRQRGDGLSLPTADDLKGLGNGKDYPTIIELQKAGLEDVRNVYWTCEEDLKSKGRRAYSVALSLGSEGSSYKSIPFYVTAIRRNNS